MSPQKKLKARLAAYEGEKLSATYPLPEPGTTIGRGVENHIQLDHPEVSRNHAAIQAKDGMWVIKDLESTNGLFVNGSAQKYAVLKPGDVVRLGPYDLYFETTNDETEWGPASEFNPATQRRKRNEDPGGAAPPPPPTRPIDR